MKATLVIIALMGTPVASLASAQVSEPALMLLSGAALLALGALVRRMAPAADQSAHRVQSSVLRPS